MYKRGGKERKRGGSAGTWGVEERKRKLQENFSRYVREVLMHEKEEEYARDEERERERVSAVRGERTKKKLSFACAGETEKRR